MAIQFAFLSVNRSRIFFKGATILYFMYYLCMAIILFDTDLYKSAFPTYSSENLEVMIK